MKQLRKPLWRAPKGVIFGDFGDNKKLRMEYRALTLLFVEGWLEI
jgi:hypothetical protein